MKQCPNCLSNNIQTYFKVHHSPKLQNVLYTSLNGALDAESITCEFWLCNDCVYIWNPIFEKPIYYENYENDQSYSKAYQRHIDQIIGIIAPVTKLNDRILEIGCGTGDILNKLVERGYKNVIGYDPSHSKNYEFVKKINWDKKMLDIADLIIIRHVLEGYHDPNKLIADTCTSLKDSGKLYLEMMSLNYLLSTAQTHNLYHEYQQYFSESSITMLLTKHGYKVDYFYRLWNGEHLGVMASKQNKKQISSLSRSSFDQFEKICIWGMSGRSIHFLTHNKIGADQVQFAVDIDPKKQGKYVPVTGQIILSPVQCIAQKPHCVIVLNPFYLDEVKKQFDYPVTILTGEDIYE